MTRTVLRIYEVAKEDDGGVVAYGQDQYGLHHKVVPNAEDLQRFQEELIVQVYGLRPGRNGQMAALGEDQHGWHYVFTPTPQDMVRFREALDELLANPDAPFPTYVISEIDFEKRVLESSESRFSEIPSTRAPRVFNSNPEELDELDRAA